MPSTRVQQTALYQTHMELGGRMVEFAGWQLPVQYPTGPTLEHQAVRSAAGLFDIDHMGQIRIEGPDAIAFLHYVQPRNLEGLAPYEAAYSLLLYADGGIVDDIFLYHLPDGWMMVVNAGNRGKDLAWLQAHALGFDVAITDISDATYMLALQGPKAETILQRLVSTELHSMAARSARETELLGKRVLLGRTGYTGEDGFELYAPCEIAVELWQQLLQAGADDGLLPCGLAARDSLRFEACMPLYGHEISASITPLEARLGWVIDWEQDFIGRNALLKQKLETPDRLLVGFEMIDRAVPREGYALRTEADPPDRPSGFVTTGMKSPTLDHFLGMGYLPKAYAKIGSEFDVVVRTQPKRARVVRRPFYRPQYKTTAGI